MRPPLPPPLDYLGLGLGLALLFVVPAPAAELEDLESIEKRISQHVQSMETSDPSTAGMLEALTWEEQQWDALMNSAYRTLLAKLPDKAKESMRVSQRAWVAYRDVEIKAQSDLFATRDGTMYLPLAADARMRLVKHRAAELASLARVLAMEQN